MERVFAASLAGLMVTAMAVSCGGNSDSATRADASPGRLIAERNGCLSCHSVDGSRRAGPSWKDLYGADVELEDGRVVVADEEYLDRAISQPGVEVVKGFAASMPSNSLSEQDRRAVIEYVKSLGATAPEG